MRRFGDPQRRRHLTKLATADRHRSTHLWRRRRLAKLAKTERLGRISMASNNNSLSETPPIFSMASFTSTATSSTWPRRMCACGYGPCIVKISRSTKNPGRPYFACPRAVPCVSWIGWCEEPRRQSTDYASSRNDIVMQLRDDVIHIQQSLRLLKTIVYVLCIVIVILLLRM